MLGDFFAKKQLFFLGFGKYINKEKLMLLGLHMDYIIQDNTATLHIKSLTQISAHFLNYLLFKLFKLQEVCSLAELAI